MDSAGGSTSRYSGVLHGGGAVEPVAGESIVVTDGGFINMGGLAYGQGYGNDGVGVPSGRATGSRSLVKVNAFSPHGPVGEPLPTLEPSRPPPTMWPRREASSWAVGCAYGKWIRRRDD